MISTVMDVTKTSVARSLLASKTTVTETVTQLEINRLVMGFENRVQKMVQRKGESTNVKLCYTEQWPPKVAYFNSFLPWLSKAPIGTSGGQTVEIFLGVPQYLSGTLPIYNTSSFS